MAKINRHLQRTFGEVLLEEADVPTDVLITISRVETTPNLRSATIYLYINPIDRADEIIERLTPQLYDLQGSLNRKLDLKPLPRIRLRIDYGAEHAEHIDHAIEQLDQDESDQHPPTT